MDKDTTEKFVIEILQKLSSIDTRLENFCKQISAHDVQIQSIDSRLAKLENVKPEDGDFKTEMLRLCGKCLVIALSSIAALTGAGSILSKIFQTN